MKIYINMNDKSVTLDEKKIKDLDLSFVPEVISIFHYNGLDGWIMFKDSDFRVPTAVIPQWAAKAMYEVSKG